MLLSLPRWLWLATIIIMGFYRLDFSYKTDALYMAQAIMTFSAVFIFSKRKSYLLASGLAAIGIADITYYLEIYKLQMTAESFLYFSTVIMIYSLGFSLIAMSLYQSTGKSLKLFWDYKLSLLPVLIFIAATGSFLIAPTTHLLLKGQFNYTILGVLAEILTCLPLIVTAYLSIIVSNEISDACLAIGALLIGLINLGIEFEYIAFGTLSFSYYDFFWLFGLLLMFARSLKSDPLQISNLPKSKSLRIQLKILILIASLLPVSVYYFLNQGDLHSSIGFFIIGTAISLLVGSIVVQYFSSQLSLLTNEIEQIFKSTNNASNSQQPTGISNEWEESLKIILKNKISQDKLEAENEKRLLQIQNELSAQVSHDIRSPLSALNMALYNTSDIPEDKTRILRAAADRINDIANTLLKQNKLLASKNKVALPELVESIVAEKKLQYQNLDLVQINSDLRGVNQIEATINESELKRSISNLINNSVESLNNNAGLVTVSVRLNDQMPEILISDNGKGLTAEQLEKVGSRGASFGKENGSGLGLYYAKQFAENSGGSLKIHSTPNQGTTVVLSLR